MCRSLPENEQEIAQLRTQTGHIRPPYLCREHAYARGPVMITNTGFSPILYGAALLGVAMASGAYMQSTSELGPVLAKVEYHTTKPNTDTPTALRMAEPVSGPNGLYRGLTFEAAPAPCAGPEQALGCVAPDLLQPEVRNVIVPVD